MPPKKNTRPSSRHLPSHLGRLGMVDGRTRSDRRVLPRISGHEEPARGGWGVLLGARRRPLLAPEVRDEKARARGRGCQADAERRWPRSGHFRSVDPKGTPQPPETGDSVAFTPTRRKPPTRSRPIVDVTNR